MLVHRLSDLGGVEVDGVDLTAPRTAEEDRALLALFNEHGLVVFRGQKLTKRQLVEAGAPFGGTMLNVPVPAAEPETPAVSVLSNRGADGDIVPEDPDKLYGAAGWHTDQGYVVAPNRGKILYGVQVPEEGGMTGFIDGQTTYAALSDHLRSRIEGLHVVQSWDHLRPEASDERKYRRDGEKELTRGRFADVLYPIVYPHPFTGAKVLNFPPMWAARIAEMPGPEGEAVARAIVEHITQTKFQYWHRYRLGDAVLWDNWRFLHAASGTPGRYARTVWSIALQSGPMIGRALATAAE
jgi:taurine dioxygenase